MTTKHTPAPWTHYDDTTPAGKTGRHEISALGRTVARIYYKDEQANADGALIAAAPDLLEACRACAAALETLQASGIYALPNHPRSPLKLAREAIAKTECKGR